MKHPERLTVQSDYGIVIQWQWILIPVVMVLSVLVGVLVAWWLR